MRSYWNLALIISFLLHALLLTAIPSSFKNNSNLYNKNKEKEIEIIPEKIEKIKEENKVILDQKKPLPYIENIMSKLMTNDHLLDIEKPRVAEKEVKEIVFSDVFQNKELKKNPAYMDYYRVIREKIKNQAYKNYNSLKKGEVGLTFVISKDGSLGTVRFGKESMQNSSLRNIALRSIKESAPFPEFPPELKDYSHLKFNLKIYFKNN